MNDNEGRDLGREGGRSCLGLNDVTFQIVPTLGIVAFHRLGSRTCDVAWNALPQIGARQTH